MCQEVHHVKTQEAKAATMSDPRINEAITLMNSFAARTGLTSGQPQRRHLWTDTFAVCNYLGLTQATGKKEYTERALQLVDQVHHTLGTRTIHAPA